MNTSFIKKHKNKSEMIREVNFIVRKLQGHYLHLSETFLRLPL